MIETPPIIVDEQEELRKELHKVSLYPRLAHWIKLFLDKSSKMTFGNRAQSAIIAYHLDPIAQYSTACKIGSENYRKVKHLAMAYYEQDGMTPAKVLDLIAAHAVAGKPKALEMLAIITEVYNPKDAQIVINNNTQINATTNIQIEPEKQKKMQEDFYEYLDNKYRSPKEPTT